MSEEKRNTPAGADGEETDIIEERHILSVPTEHTGGTGEPVRLPDDDTDELRPPTGGRFIKTGETPFVSVRAEQDEQQDDAAGVSKYTDRLTTRASVERRHTGYTGKLNTFDAVHGAVPGDSRMIRPQEEASGAEPAAAADEKGGPAEPEAEGEQISIALPEKTEPEQTEEPSSSVAEDGTKTVRDTRDLPPSSRPQAPAGSSTHYVGDKGERLRELADSAGSDVRRNPDQMMIEGFDELEQKEERVRQEEEQHIENALEESRKNRMGAFKFWGPARETRETGDQKFSDGRASERSLPGFLQRVADRFSELNSDFAPSGSEEYTEENDRKAILRVLLTERRNLIARIALVGGLGLFLLILDLVVEGSAAAHDGAVSLFGGGPAVYITVNLLVALAVAGVLAGDLKNGVFSLLKVRPKADTSLFLLYLVGAVQCIAAYFTRLSPGSDFHLLTPAVVLLSVPYLLAKLYYTDSTRHCFKAASAHSDKSYLRKVSDPKLVSRLLYESRKSGHNVVYSGKTRFISNLLRRCAGAAYAGMPPSRVVLGCAGLSAIFGLAAWIIKGSFALGVTACLLCLAFSFPIGCVIATGWALGKSNEKLSLRASFVLSYADARDFSAVDNIAADAAELFDTRITNCLTAKNVSERQARFVAASIAATAGSLMKKTFAEDIAAFEEKLAPADNLIYEDRLGLSAWVSGCRVLFGSYGLLVNHNVAMPQEEAVRRQALPNGELPLYLAIEGRFTALFAVQYEKLATVGAGLSALVGGGSNLLISTTDANITDRFAEELLSLPDGSVRIVSYPAAVQLADAGKAVTDAEEAGIVFPDTFSGLCACAAEAIRLDQIKKISRIFGTAASAALLLAAAVLVFTGAFTGANAIPLILVQTLAIAICFVSPLCTGLLKKVRLPAFPKKGGEEEPEEEEAEPEAAQEPEEAQEPAAPEEPAPEAEEEPGETPAGEPEPAPAPPAEEPQDDLGETVERIIPKEEPPEPEVRGEVSEETESYLDRLSPKDGPHERPFADLEEGPAAPDAAPEAEADGEPEPGTDDEDDDMRDDFGEFEDIGENEPDGDVKGLLRRVKTGLRGVISRGSGTAPQRRPRAAHVEPEEEEDRFSLFSDEELAAGRAEDPEADYERQRREEEALRESFTAPPEPDAPDFTVVDYHTGEAPEPAGFTLPPDDDVVFDDEYFSRFEDDKVFAGLHDDEPKRRRRDD